MPIAGNKPKKQLIDGDHLINVTKQMLEAKKNKGKSTPKGTSYRSRSSGGGGGGGASFDIDGLIADIQKAIDAQYQTEEDGLKQQNEMVRAAILDAIAKERNRYTDTETNLHTSRDSSIKDMRENVQRDALTRGMARSSYSVDNATENEAEIRKQVEMLVGQAMRDMNTNVSSYEKQQTLNDQALATNIVGLIRRREAEKAAQGSQMRYSHFMNTRRSYGGGSSDWNLYDALNNLNTNNSTSTGGGVVDTRNSFRNTINKISNGNSNNQYSYSLGGNFNPRSPANPNHQYYDRSNATSWRPNSYKPKKEKQPSYLSRFASSFGRQ